MDCLAIGEYGTVFVVESRHFTKQYVVNYGSDHIVGIGGASGQVEGFDTQGITDWAMFFDTILNKQDAFGSKLMRERLSPRQLERLGKIAADYQPLYAEMKKAREEYSSKLTAYRSTRRALRSAKRALKEVKKVHDRGLDTTIQDEEEPEREAS